MVLLLTPPEILLFFQNFLSFLHWSLDMLAWGLNTACFWNAIMIKTMLRRYSQKNITFTKKNYKKILEKRNLSETEIKKELLNPNKLVLAEKETRTFENKKEIRYRCYFIYSNSKGICVIIKLNKKLKIITAFPLGRKTLNRYRKRFK